MDNVATDIDLIEELRLRRWAREHYVSAERRENAWHPIVIDEMSNKDREMSTAYASTA